MNAGKLLWTSHARGWWGRVTRFLDYVPIFTNELRDTPHHINGNEVFCDSGRVLDILTGTELRRVPQQVVEQFEEPLSAARLLYDGMVGLIRSKIQVGPCRWLSHWKTEQDRPAGSFALYLLDENDSILWELNSRTTGMHINGNFYSYRFVSHPGGSPFIYLIVSEEPNYKQHPSSSVCIPNPTRYHLLSFNVFEGRVVGDTLVDENNVTDCRIEDVDDLGVLVSLNSLQLKYYQYSAVTSQ